MTAPCRCEWFFAVSLYFLGLKLRLIELHRTNAAPHVDKIKQIAAASSFSLHLSIHAAHRPRPQPWMLRAVHLGVRAARSK